MSLLENRLLFSSSEDSDEDNVVRRKKILRSHINFGRLTGVDFKERFRLRESEVETVLQFIAPLLKHRTTKNRALSPEQQLLVCLHWLGNGCQYHGIGDMHGISKTTVCRVIHRVVKAIVKKMFKKFVRWPEKMEEVALEFLRQGGFPSVIGCVDGTLVNIDAPKNNESAFVDRHGKHSINAMMVCGPDYSFYYVSARWPGSVHDSRVLRNSNLCKKFDNGWRPFPGAVILGDTGYGAKDWLIPPVCKNPDSQAEINFNRTHKGTRRFIECSYGILKERFPCLHHLRVEPIKACNIIIACAILHNIATKEDFTYNPDQQNEMPEERWQVEPSGTAEARINEFLAYFS